jgi:hypothetical protein
MFNTKELGSSGPHTAGLGSNPCQNALLAIPLEPYAVSNEATLIIANPLTDEGYNREQVTEAGSKARKKLLIVN